MGPKKSFIDVFVAGAIVFPIGAYSLVWNVNSTLSISHAFITFLPLFNRNVVLLLISL